MLLSSAPKEMVKGGLAFVKGGMSIEVFEGSD